MIELGTTTTKASGGDGAIVDVNDQTFMADVIEASQQVPVIVDFWAPWCGPCKQLTPVLEEAVKGAGGAVRLAKVNVDQSQMVASQLRVQSIPTVYAFYQGQPVDGFQGAVQASEAKAFVQRLIDLAGGQAGGGLDEALEQAEGILEQGQAADAAQVFAAIGQEDPANGRATAGLVRALLAMGETAAAKKALADAPAEVADDPAIAAARAAIELADAAGQAGEAAALRARVEADPGDHQARYDLAMALLAERDHKAAVDELLELFRRDREWNDGAARTQLFKIFESLGPKDPVAQAGRRRLSSMVFA
ncbi:MAG TPA: tetratricopeptide repeat protein [Thermohalobaculum sp.]|nr:tetratricopeptide repeat protein [Thermohalobaculum sp.]